MGCRQGRQNAEGESLIGWTWWAQQLPASLFQSGKGLDSDFDNACPAANGSSRWVSARGDAKHLQVDCGSGLSLRGLCEAFAMGGARDESQMAAFIPDGGELSFAA